MRQVEESNSLAEKLRSSKYKYLGGHLSLLAFCIAFLLFGVAKVFFREGGLWDNILTGVAAFLMFFLLRCAGFVAMIRKEFYQLVVLRGKTAQFYGLIMWLGGWGFALYALYLLILDFYTMFTGLK